uniref:Uncharacterized protein n=1 Tax=Lepeophtheirus salmonis TaxID=72036 RepID=A0A0K2T1K6_LEPSM
MALISSYGMKYTIILSNILRNLCMFEHRYYNSPSQTLMGRGICTMNDQSIKDDEIHQVRHRDSRSLEQNTKRGLEGNVTRISIGENMNS